jgi:hypothetical protein
MGCFVSKNDKTNKEKINDMIYELHTEINRLKSISDKISFDNVYLKEKLSFMELEHKRMSV